MVKKILVLLYAVTAYLLFLTAYGYFLLFMDNRLLEKTADSAPALAVANFGLLFNFMLLFPFCLTHSFMARRSFRRALNRWAPKVFERPIYITVTSLSLLSLCFFWQPVGPVIWDVDYFGIRTLLELAFWGGVALTLTASYILNHFELYGVSQVWSYLRDRPLPVTSFKNKSVYKIVRHPMQLGMLMVLWAAPKMTLGHFFLSLGFTCYILLALQLEERDLVDVFGAEYRLYREQVPMIFPIKIGDIFQKIIHRRLASE